MSSHQEKARFHPKRPSPVGDDDFELGEIERHVVDGKGIGVDVPGSREDGRARVDDNRDALFLGPPIHHAQGF